MPNPPVTVIVPSYNQATTVVGCLRSLSRQTYSPHEIIVVDSSTNEVPDLIRRHFPEVRLIRREEKTWTGPARNIGVGAAETRLFAFTDTDCLAPADWLEELMAAYDPDSRPIVAGSVANGTPHSPVGTADHLLEFSEFLPELPTRMASVCLGGNFLVDAGRYEAAGGFPEELSTGEDTAFSFTLSRAGHPTHFRPAARVVHMNRTRLRDLLRHQFGLGVGFARGRRGQPSLPGAFLVRHRWLLPFLPGIRWLRLFHRYLRTTPPRIALTFLLLTPVTLLGLVAWTAGMKRGLDQADQSERT